ncbi:nucleoside-diphosphate-sugar pyrophosphorylase [Deferribacter desulfuricans SSM1]|uniref:Nucleoside-diphosphate-sugar pyrophosphorylase n=1 Tax=Deferribacter desulfuricans (strain DSM 14783 / JCM 11476 / NBRC 101012 / SSM1) TaxID=639282 RepID=D3PB98_DEFDS|nr:nucleotidyltransferase family protein [Deferribacter desulfuricans]BAI79871.1 nucleoside-diphosphate-sugar pyrophosphorylase [Deferribacter desulfuricans SSM1]
MKNLEKVLIEKKSSAISALKQLNESSTKVLIVIENLKSKKLVGTITDGDIRRHILKAGFIEGNVYDVCNKNPIYIIKDKLDKEIIKNLILNKKLELIPVVNEKNEVIDYIEWSDFLKEKDFIDIQQIDEKIPVVIMAGGKGTRMKPFTEVLPKPLIPVGDKTAVELIIDEFRKFGLDNFIFTLNYKGEIIEAYFNTIEKDYKTDFIWEKDFLGTAGSLKFLENKDIKDDFIVSNCDILIKANFKEILDFHKKNKAVLTSVTSIQHYKVPYGVVEINSGGKIKKIIEKPEYTFQINTGVYILNKKALKYIPENKYFDMPQLIDKLIENKETVLAYPIKEKDYIDLGQWEEYKKALKIFEEFRNV